MKIPSSEHVVYLCTQIDCFLCFDIQSNLCTQYVLSLEFSCTELVINEQSFVILWVSWEKNKCFWKRFTRKGFKSCDTCFSSIFLIFCNVYLLQKCTIDRLCETLGNSSQQVSHNLSMKWLWDAKIDDAKVNLSILSTQALHKISLRESVCTVRVCEALLSLASTLIDLGVLANNAARGLSMS